MIRAALFAIVFALTLQAQDAREIVRRSVERDARNFERFRDYTFQQLTEQQLLDKRGSATRTESELNDVLILGGRFYYRLLEKDGRPLSEKDSRKEQEKLDREAAKRAIGQRLMQLLMRCAYLLQTQDVCAAFGKPLQATAPMCSADSVEVRGCDRER